jgi:Bacterial Ig domain
MRTMSMLIGLGFVGSLMVVACGDDTVAPDGTVAPDSGTDTVSVAPTAEFKALSAFDGIQGTKEITATVSASVDKLELLADDKAVAEVTKAPFSISFDSTKVSDGVVKLKLKAYAGTKSAESDAITVVIYNNGTKATWLAGNSGTMTIKSGMDNHLKYHWNMPDSVKQVIAVLFWKDKSFKMELAVGTGTCPHSGTKAMDVKGDTSPLPLVFGDGKTNLTVCQWFAHAGATNEPDMLDKSTVMTIEAYLLK